MRLKTIILLLFSIVILFTFDVKADCPQGYERSSWFYYYTEPGKEPCRITIYFCWILEDGKMDVSVDEITADLPCGIDITYNSTFFTILGSELKNGINNLGLLIDPCNVHSTPLSYKKYDCWKIENNYPYSMNLWPCKDEGTCLEVYEWCFNVQNDIYLYTLIARYSLQDPTCPAGYPQLPPPGYSTNQYWITGCYRLDNYYCTPYP